MEGKSADQSEAYQATPNTVFAWAAVGATAAEIVNPVVPTEVTNVFSVPAAIVVGAITTVGVEGNVDP